MPKSSLTENVVTTADAPQLFYDIDRALTGVK